MHVLARTATATWMMKYEGSITSYGWPGSLTSEQSFRIGDSWSGQACGSIEGRKRQREETGRKKEGSVRTPEKAELLYN